MGKRGIQSPASKSAHPQRPSRLKCFPWERKGLSRAERVIAFCEFLPITSGMHAGRKLKLREWQRDIVRGIYATNRRGRRVVRTGLITCPRKQGKTTLAAALCLCALLGPESERRGEIPSAASDREQAAIIFREMEAMILHIPEFSSRCHIETFHRRITDTISGSVYEACTADSTKAHGRSPSFSVYDELAQAKNRELYDNLVTGMGARKEPLMVDGQRGHALLQLPGQ